MGPRTRTRHAETQIRGLAPVASPFEEGRAVGAPAEPSPFPSQPCESARGGERFVTGGGGGVSAAARAQCCVRDGVYMVARARRRVHGGACAGACLGMECPGRRAPSRLALEEAPGGAARRSVRASACRASPRPHRRRAGFLSRRSRRADAPLGPCVVPGVFSWTAGVWRVTRHVGWQRSLSLHPCPLHVCAALAAPPTPAASPGPGENARRQRHASWFCSRSGRF